MASAIPSVKGPNYYNRLVKIGALTATACALLVLLGWYADIPVVKSLGRGLATMKFNTALGFVLTGLASYWLCDRRNRPRVKRSILICATLALLLTGVTIVEYLAEVNLHIDELFIADPATAPENHPGRMSEATALGLFLVSVAQLLLASRYRRWRTSAQLILLLVLIGSMVGLCGHFLNAQALYHLPWFGSYSLPTAILFFVVSQTTLFAFPGYPVTRPLVSPQLGGYLARRLLPLALIVPMLVGWCLLQCISADIFSAITALELFIVMIAFVFCVLIWTLARTMNRIHGQLLEQHEQLREAERSKSLLAAFVTSSVDAIIGLDRSGQVTVWNDAAEGFLGLRREAIIGHPFSDTPLVDAFSENDLERVARGEILEPIAFTGQRPDGYTLDLSLTLSPVRSGPKGITGIAVIARDLSAYHEMEQQLRESAHQLQEFKDALDEHAIVATTDARGRITYVNDRFCAVSQYSREELIGQDHRILNSGYHPKEFFRDLWDTIRGGKIWHGNIRNFAKDGSTYWVDTTIVPFLGPDGHPRQYVAIRTEITQQIHAAKELEEQKEELLRSNEDLSQFAYIASHDLQEPLRGVSGCLELLQRRYEGKLDERGQEYMRHALDGIVRMQNLVRDLLTYSRVGTRQRDFQSFPLNEAIENARLNLATAITESNATITISPLPDVFGDKTMLSQLFQNLIGNAIKFRSDAAPEITISAAKTIDGWAITVADNGIGIDPQYFEKIFVIFQRLHARDRYVGTGIGLALCKRIILRHGGKIWVESRPGEGSKFHFTLKESMAAIRAA